MSMAVCVNRSEFVKRQIGAIWTILRGGAPAYFGSEPIDGDRTRLLLRTCGVTYATIIEPPRLSEFESKQIRVIDRPAAHEIVAASADEWLDEAIQSQNLTRLERRALKLRSEQTPCEFAWVAIPDGRHLIWAYSATRSPLWPPGEWRELAAHPREYGDIWRVVERAPCDELGGGALYFDCSPSLERWAQFEAADARLRAKCFAACHKDGD